MMFTAIRSRYRYAVASIAFVAIAGALLLWGPAAAQVDVHVVWPAATVRSEFQDFGRDGLRLGDRLVSRGPLLDAAQTSEVGTAHQDCVVMRRIIDGPSGPGGLYRCSYLLNLAKGDLIVEGLDPHGPGVYTMAVLGGTRAYAGATGDATLTDTETETDFVIHVTP